MSINNASMCVFIMYLKADLEIENLKKASKKQGVDLSSCDKIAKKVKKNIEYLADNAASCIKTEIAEANLIMESIREKFDKLKKVLLQYKNSSALYDSHSSAIQKVACLKKVSQQVY